MVFDIAKIRLRALVSTGLTAAALMAAASFGPAHAQNQQPAAGAENLGNWIKICTKDPQADNKNVCLVTQEVRTDAGEFLASVSVREVEGEDGKTLMVAVPPGTLLQPGIRVQVDEGEQQAGKYVICLPNACYAELEIAQAFVNKMKAGKNLVVSVINNQGKAVGVGLTLVGFTKGYDGAPVDTEVLAQQRQKLQEELQKRAEEARKRLADQNGQQQQGDNAGQSQ
ncbi:invasion associated locus B family protein [Lutibaculum baratangense]|uniref:Uncharacterized protein n=1 Tax=Lutibaculum baratangense AMV1 TaxID=631454 RepID=V4RU12_9HYPH|nr:invasion associated locus B family protein [Lutibaculum baratangense]ESR26585.1 putative exported protein of unknown function [Lutibaculum baratangense AMV1]